MNVNSVFVTSDKYCIKSDILEIFPFRSLTRFTTTFFSQNNEQAIITSSRNLFVFPEIFDHKVGFWLVRDAN